MGAWDFGNLDNDSALDFLDEFENAKDKIVCLSNLLSNIAVAGDYIDADLGSQGLAAAELVAAVRGKPNPKLSNDASANAATLKADDALVALARRTAVKVKSEQSELRDLWEETSDYAQWVRAVDELTERLTS